MAEVRILIVEDESSVREMIAYTLSKAGFAPYHAENSKEAFNQIADNNPDLILLDWMLPEHSGIEIARRLRKDIKTKDRGEAYEGLKRIWFENFKISSISSFLKAGA